MLEAACQREDADVLDVLLADPRVDPCTQAGAVFGAAHARLAQERFERAGRLPPQARSKAAPLERLLVEPRVLAVTPADVIAAYAEAIPLETRRAAVASTRARVAWARRCAAVVAYHRQSPLCCGPGE